MKILFITEIFPYPLDSGGKIVTYQTLQMLSRWHKIYLLALCSRPPSRTQLRAITSLRIHVTVVKSKKRNAWFKQSKSEIFNTMLQLKPLFLTPFYDRAFALAVTRILAKERFDILHVDHLSMAQYLPEIKKERWILHEHNIEYKLQKQLFTIPSAPFKAKLFSLYNAVTMVLYERAALTQFDQIIVLSKQDKIELIKIGIHPTKILHIPPIVTPIKYKLHQSKNTKELLFIGHLWWKPNLDAVNWILKKIFPLIGNCASLTVVGEGAKEWGRLNHVGNSIRTIEKPKSIAPYLTQASIFVAPFRIGEGVRIKILTAFAHSIPIVSTSPGVRGVEVSAEKEYLEANDVESFVAQIQRLFYSPKLSKTLTTNAIKFITKYHNSVVVQKKFLKSYGKTNR